ncbi:hypothetical protein Tco_0019685 [Tanacetum coccineum]
MWRAKWRRQTHAMTPFTRATGLDASKVATLEKGEKKLTVAPNDENFKYATLEKGEEKLTVASNDSNGKSEESHVDLIDRAKLQFREETNTGNKKLNQEHAWRVLKEYPKWDALDR